VGNRKPKTLILDIYGAYARQLSGWLAVAELVKLMGELGMDEQAVRSTVSRMTRRGLIVPEKRNQTQGYRLTEHGQGILEEGDRRIFTSKEPADLADGWVLVVFSMPERDRHKRHLLRSRLTWLGFGNLSSGVWIAPRRILPELMETIRAMGLEEYVNVFHAVYRGFSNLSEIVQQSWDLNVMREFYSEFLQECQPILRRWSRAGTRPEGQSAFIDYTLTLHRWRKFPYLDPGLPSELLPTTWEGYAAANAFFEVRSLLETPAQRYVEGLVLAGRASALQASS
jgi:phenylacetic acid degradation operon negative regulatory protein